MSAPSSAAPRQVVRKSGPDKLADFDEHWWPITLLLLFTAGALMGYVYIRPQSDFTTQVWYRNAWVQIGSIGATALVLILGATLLSGSSQRRLQLGIFLSLLFHTSLLFGSRHYLLSLSGAPSSEPELHLTDEVPVTLPDYYPTESEDQTSSALTRPAETTLREEAKIEITPKTPEQMKAIKKTIEQPEPTRDQPPTPIELARIEPKTPQPSQMLPDESLVRRDLERTLQAESVPQKSLKAVTESNRTLEEQNIDTNRREAEMEQLRRLDASTPRAADAVRPTINPLTPERRDLPDQTASADVAAELSRRLTPAAAPALPNTPIETMTAQSAQQSPLDGPRSTVEAPARQAAAASSGAVAAIESPSIALLPGSTAPAALSRAEAPESSDAVSATLPTNRRQRVSAGGSAAGIETIAVDAPTAPTTIATGAGGGSNLEAPLMSTTRGDQGVPQSPSASEVALPSPIGDGVGVTVGSPSVGPMRRSDAAGDGTAGEAGSSNIVARPGRGRAVGAAIAANNLLTGGDLAAVINPVARPGNATSGDAPGTAPAVSGTGSSLGERTVVEQGEGLRPLTLGGATGTGLAPSAGAGMLADGGAASGIVGGSGLGAAAPSAAGTGAGAGSGSIGAGGIAGGPSAGSASTARRELGELAGSASGSAAESLIGGRRARMDQSDMQRDRHGNLKGSANDLIVDGQMIGEKIVIVTFYAGEEIVDSPLIGALAAKGYAVERLSTPLPPVGDFARQLDGARQLWLISSDVNRLPETHLRVLLDRWRAGRLALCLMADNTPYTAEAKAVLDVVAPGTTISGDYLGEKKLHARGDAGPGFIATLALFHNVETLYEGTTISHINSRYLTPVCYASNGLPLIGIYRQEGSSRLLVHCGFTSLYERFWDDAGVSRFAVNVAGWLSEADTKPVPSLPVAPPRR